MAEDALPQRARYTWQRSDHSSKLFDDDDDQELSEDGTATKVRTIHVYRCLYNRCLFPGLILIVKPKNPSKLMKRVKLLYLDEHLESIAPDGICNPSKLPTQSTQSGH